MSILSAFNTQIVNLLNELNQLFPEDKDIEYAKDGVVLLKKTNPRIIYKGFMNYIYKFKEKINNEDDSFFFEEHKDIENDDYMQLILKNLQTYWKTLTNNTKKNLWLYFKVLIKLSEKI